MKYYANYNANNGTRFSEPLEDTNKNRLIRDIRDIAKGERFVNSECTWSVYDENGSCVAFGGVTCDGRSFTSLF